MPENTPGSVYRKHYKLLRVGGASGNIWDGAWVKTTYEKFEESGWLDMLAYRVESGELFLGKNGIVYFSTGAMEVAQKFFSWTPKPKASPRSVLITHNTREEANSQRP